MIRPAVLAAVCVLPLLALVPPSPLPQASALAGRVLTPAGAPATGATVVATPLGGGRRFATGVSADGSFRLTDLPAGLHRIDVRHGGFASLTLDSVAPSDVPLLLQLVEGPAAIDLASDAWLGLLPAGESKRRFILDCTGCHRFDESRAFRDGAPRTEARWADDVRRMVGFAGARGSFPVIADDRDAAATAAWLAARVTGRPAPRPPVAGLPTGPGTVTEYDFPVPPDLPHDLAVDTRTGRVIVTGMFSHRMWVLDPGAVTWTPEDIPVPQANPRAVELDSDGNWYVLLGNPKQIARRDHRSRSWRAFAIGLYPHSIVVAHDDRIWFNGHFTRDPELIGSVTPDGEEVRTMRVPPHPTLATVPGGPIPYELRQGPDGRVWMSELQGNRIVSYDQRTNHFTTHTLPTPWSGPRRLDVGPDGTVWIPAYAANLLVRFDPRTETFREIPLPVPDAVPYVVRVHPRTGAVWIGTAAADLVLRYDPARDAFTQWPLPSRGALVRHMAIDPTSSDVWLAYGASPSHIPARIARVRPDE